MEFSDFETWGTLGHQIVATGPEKGVCLDRPQSDRGIEKIKSTYAWSKQWKRVEFFSNC